MNEETKAKIKTLLGAIENSIHEQRVSTSSVNSYITQIIDLINKEE